MNNNGVLHRIAQLRDGVPPVRRAILDLIAADPERVLEESFEQLATRSASSVPTIMRTCRDLGFAGLREFKLALAQELAVSGSPLHRRVQPHDDTAQVVAKITRSAASVVARAQGAKVIAITQPGAPLAERADVVLGIRVPDDPVMHVGTDAYLAHLTVLEILTVMVAQRLGDDAIARLRGVREVLGSHGIDTRAHPLLNWASKEQ